MAHHVPPITPAKLNRGERRRAFFRAYLNGALWALGNGLGSTALIIYLVRQLGAAGLGIGVVLAAPHITGALRLAAPALVGRIASRRSFCMLCYGASAVLLAVISQLAEPGRLRSPTVTLQSVVALWCVYHLLEYLGTVVLWSWLGDIAPRAIRGRFIGVRERWMLLARIVGMLAAGGFSWGWMELYPQPQAWAGYAIPACAAAALMMAAILPLARLPDARGDAAQPAGVFANLLQPLADVRMLWLLAFGVWFSLANGLTQSAQFLFPIVAFSLPLLARNIYTSGMRLGQAALAPTVGRWADLFSNRRVIVVAQLVVATGPLFFLWAARVDSGSLLGAPLSWWCLSGAWIAWIAYVGLNVGLPNLMLRLAGGGDKAAYVAWYFAVTGVVYGLASIAGGALYTWLGETNPTWTLASVAIDHHDALFTCGFVLRAAAVLFLLPLRETRDASFTQN